MISARSRSPALAPEGAVVDHLSNYSLRSVLPDRKINHVRSLASRGQRIDTSTGVIHILAANATTAIDVQ